LESPELLPPPQTATQLLPVRALTCSVLVSTLVVLVLGAAFVIDDTGNEFERPFVVFSLLPLEVVLLVLPAFIIRLLTAAWATDLKSASVGGLDRTDAVEAPAEADETVWGDEVTFLVRVADDAA